MCFGAAGAALEVIIQPELMTRRLPILEVSALEANQVLGWSRNSQGLGTQVIQSYTHPQGRVHRKSGTYHRVLNVQNIYFCRSTRKCDMT